MKRLVLLVPFLALSITGCVATSDVIEVDRNVYSVSATADGMRTAASARQNVYEVAQQKCAAQGKHLQLINESIGATRMGIDTTIDVTFRCLDANDPAYGAR